MKRLHFLLFSLAFSVAVAVGYSDSHVIKKDTIQVDHGGPSILALATHQSHAFERPADLVVFAPDLGRPAYNHIEVSEELTDVIVIRIRPPPEKVQKSDYNFT